MKSIKSIHERGSMPLVVLMTLAVISTAVYCAWQTTTSVSRNVSRTNNYREAVEIGDGVIEYMFAHWREKCRPTPNVHFKGTDFAAIPMPTGGHNAVTLPFR
jgi:hypothetical protein